MVEVETSGIEGVALDSTFGANSMYDLNGRKLKEPQKGINIIGGKKVLLK